MTTHVHVELEDRERSDRATTRVLERLLELIERNLEGAVSGPDPELLHDFRVAVRRTRSVQRQMRRALPRRELRHFREEFRWLQRITGDARDLDVYVIDFDEERGRLPRELQPGLGPILDALQTRRAAAHLVMARELRSLRVARLSSGWRSFLDRAANGPDDGDAAQPVGAVAGRRIVLVYGQMVRMGSAIGPASPASGFHELRKKGKELRYLLELFGTPLYSEEVVRPMVRSLKALQGVLGRHQDREVQLALLRDLKRGFDRAPDGTVTAAALQELMTRWQAEAREARSAFAERFEAFASPQQRWLVKETFA